MKDLHNLTELAIHDAQPIGDEPARLDQIVDFEASDLCWDSQGESIYSTLFIQSVRHSYFANQSIRLTRGGWWELRCYAQRSATLL